MDEKYICPKLIKILFLLYGKKCKPYAKEKDGIFVFGSKKFNTKNKVTKPVAIFIITTNIKELKEALK